MEFDLDGIRKKVSRTSLVQSASIIHPTESGTDSGPPTEQHDPEMERILCDYDPSALCSRKDFLFELGIPHDVFFRQLIEYNGGSLPQKRFSRYTNLSSTTISRLLGEMEDDRQIVRVKFGREKVAFLPEHAPSDGRPSADEPDSPRHKGSD